MKKVVIHKAGGYEQLKIEACAAPKPTSKEVLISVKAIGINYADCCVRWGIYESAKEYVGWPITPGFEVSGEVEEVGSEVTQYKKGDRVIGITFFNGYSSKVSIPEHQVFLLPQNLTFEQGAAFPAVHLTAYHALHQLVKVRKNGTVLVHSAAGGVGSALVQLCKLAGLRVVGVVGSSHKVEAVKKLGADFVIDKSSAAIWRECEKICLEGFDAVFDANGAETLKESYRHLAPTGKLIAYGAHTLLPKVGGRLNYLSLAWKFLQIPRFQPLEMISSNRSIAGFNLSFLFSRRDLLDEGMNDLLAWVSKGVIQPPAVTIFPMEQVGKAHAAIESGKTIGKLVLVP